MQTRFAAAVFAFALSLPALGAGYTMEPSSGPATGGTEVTLHGDFTRMYGLLFGGSPATNVRTIDANTITAVTPEHLPGPVSVSIMQLMPISTGMTFTFTGDVPPSYERVLLPIFIKPVQGQHGSEFVTSFTAQLQRGELVHLHGLDFTCTLICPPDWFGDAPLGLVPNSPRLDNEHVVHSGNPGRFVIIPKDEVANVAMNLRVYDRSRSTSNYGTEIPVVRERSFTEGSATITLLNVPTDPQFRNTLRLYGTGPVIVGVRIQAATMPAKDVEVTLSAGGNVFEPATAAFTDFPAGVGMATVTITIPSPFRSDPPPPPRVWAFISTTNNDTQLITTITPQP